MNDQDNTSGDERSEEVSMHVIGPMPPVLPVNSVGIHAGAFDMTLDLAYKAGDAPAQITARVAMSYEHAQILARVIQRQVDAYVEKVGHPIPDLEDAGDRQGAR